ncbi:MAG: ABC transporter ATP-binding protein [Sphingomonadaceae bacterium]
MNTILDIQDLTIRFGGLTAVSGLSFGLETGEIVGLIGPNGSGKTTVFNMISGFYTPTSGSIRFEGKVINGLRPDQITALGIARIFQANRLFREQSVLDNVLIAHHLRLKSNPVSAILRLPSYTKQIDEAYSKSMWLLENLGLASFAHEKAGSLPHGMQRKLEVARALATEPRLLLLDEPAAGLSHEEVTDMMDFVLTIRKEYNLTVLLVEHHMRVVMTICPRIVVLNHGQMIAHGSPDQIANDPVVIKAYLGESRDDA